MEGKMAERSGMVGLFGYQDAKLDRWMDVQEWDSHSDFEHARFRSEVSILSMGIIVAEVRKRPSSLVNIP